MPDLVGKAGANARNSARKRGGGEAEGNLEKRVNDADIGEAGPSDAAREAGEEAKALRHRGPRTAVEGERFEKSAGAGEALAILPDDDVGTLREANKVGGERGWKGAVDGLIAKHDAQEFCVQVENDSWGQEFVPDNRGVVSQPSDDCLSNPDGDNLGVEGVADGREKFMLGQA